jgi:hypothetical protein
MLDVWFFKKREIASMLQNPDCRIVEEIRMQGIFPYCMYM